jgi:uncharacterized membrane protein YfcA
MNVSGGVLVLLMLMGLVGGIGITAVGPGGVLPTIGLVILTDLSPASVAGTSIVTHIGTGIVGTAAYTRSGQLREPDTRRVAALLAAAAVAGTPLGVLANSWVEGDVFAVLLAVAVAVVGVLVWVREHHLRREESLAPLAAPLVLGVGLGVALVAGLFGLGGPMLSVPLLVICGLPVRRALGAAQAQSVVIAAVGTAGYLAQGTIDWPLAFAIGVPELAGVLIGWRVAHAVSSRQLKYALAIVLVSLTPYLALHG